ncbi:UDP-N-acetylmuramoyl-L-alanyl-D-glutamate--2,6-diaminopimelate ligase [Fictibacillus fluitans]|uniref:UDP-N-acetylmuramyl-tripeptide synthetase n=1 Tax=Fictibacillus fluitans TaxID=3058422 RepID=A0ABT8HT69_9BACL|nr:UDP-N-acetylmuramoyl-L-alanyl-D-glutamate--2,6-diaminopimelate ligase [Fictibacillus sp. NE201]MDN4523924.1 UDP-N-acetylmuramoyl-L-alanyl-D-glutamate--2,6-diaminopimelate ligase [Fictibacillus sp. NE201]
MLNLIKIRTEKGNIPPEITGIQTDSRKVEPGNIFVCMTGHTVDGHDFISQAIGNGATLIIAKKESGLIDLDHIGLVLVKDTVKVLARLLHHYWRYPTSSMTTIGVTGTNGKTTVSHLIHELMLLMGERSAVAGTLGFHLNDAHTPTANTTSDLTSNLNMASQAAEQECDAMIFEMSSHGLVQGRVWGIEFDIAVFTNLSYEHLEYHQTMEKYEQAKGLLFAQLGQDLRKEKYAVINADDPRFHTYSSVTPFEVISYGFSEHADFRASDMISTEEGMEFMLHTPQGSFTIRTQLIGTFNVYNIMAAMASLYAKGAEVKEMARVVPFAKRIRGRMEKVSSAPSSETYIDYAHTPDAIEKAMDSLLHLKKGRLIIVIGGGDFRDHTKRPMMAEKASKADYVIITTNNPGYEPVDKILSDFQEGMLHNRYRMIGDRKEAIHHALEYAGPDDLVLVTDKGHQTTQLVGGTKTPHSDKQIVMEYMKQKLPMK